MSYPPSVYKTWVNGETLTAADLNNSFQVIPNTNIPEDTDDYSANTAEMQTTTDPYPSSVASLATNLAGEVERLRYQILQINKAIKGSTVTNWYEDAPTADILKIGSSTADVSSLKLTGNGDANSNKIINLAAAALASDAARFDQTRILQVVVGTSGTKFSTDEGTYQSTNLSASITPSSTDSKILVMAFSVFGITDTTTYGAYCLANDTTTLVEHQLFANGNLYTVPASIATLHSPATTSALTYRVRIKSVGSPVSTIRWGTTAVNDIDSAQVMILMEVNGI